MLCEKLLYDFYDKLGEVRSKTSNHLDEANQMIVVCTQTLGKMKKEVVKNGFKTMDKEIDFFKNVKAIPMQYLIYYTEVRSCELRMPKIGVQHKLKFLENQVTKVNSFFSRHTEFLIYIDQGYTHFDKHYYLREHLNNSPIVKSYPYYKDPTFNTSHDGLLARIRGLGIYIHYLKESKAQLENSEAVNNSSKINWTGSYTSFIEMIYGCDAMNYFNDGNIEINKVIEELGDFLNVPKGNYTRTYNDLKNRQKSRIKFFEEAGQKLINKMDKEDGQVKNG